MRTECIRLSGIVQGVGLRPWIYRLANERGLCGTVGNDAAGVRIIIAGLPAVLDEFVGALRNATPPLCRIERVERSEYLAGSARPAAGFRIIDSRAGPARTGVAADAATCAACLAEIRDPADRRFGYAFTNCTHCGPRFSIVHAIPYDRCNTSMQSFTQCAACTREYRDPGNRRFHAQPNACAVCGPRLWLEACGAITELDSAADPIGYARTLILAGHIVAIKGLGGFHLACNAHDEQAVARLRARKQRYEKPFALMARDLAVIERYCVLSDQERRLLQSAAAPIVLIARDARHRRGAVASVPDAACALADSIAKGMTTLGFMLPYTPLHHLLMQPLDTPIVMTSGNVSDEPQCIDNDAAREQLRGIADYLLLHDRVIVNRVDDSVVRVAADSGIDTGIEQGSKQGSASAESVSGTVRWLRRARGAAPSSLSLPAGFEAAPPVLAFGGELKNTFCLLRAGQAIVSHHIGDLQNAATHAHYRDTMALYQRLFAHEASLFAVDLHPDYLSSKLGRARAIECSLPLVEVQHHHAHIAACLAENAVPLEASPVLGIAFDGLGLGEDGSWWGGEFLLADYRQSQRLAAFAPIPMPGAAQAIREPWRMAWAYLSRYCDTTALRRDHAQLDFFERMQTRPVAVIEAMIRSHFNCPSTSSCGRLFDAVSALAGVFGLDRDAVGYEGQAAIALEACIDRTALQHGERYRLNVIPGDRDTMAWIDSAPLWPALIGDLAAVESHGRIAARFHNALIEAVVKMVGCLANAHRNPWQNRIALSGGVFQNQTLHERLIAAFQTSGHTVYSHAQVPANDGGLALGQAAVAAARSIAAGAVAAIEIDRR